MEKILEGIVTDTVGPNGREKGTLAKDVGGCVEDLSGRSDLGGGSFKMFEMCRIRLDTINFSMVSCLHCRRQRHQSQMTVPLFVAKRYLPPLITIES